MTNNTKYKIFRFGFKTTLNSSSEPNTGTLFSLLKSAYITSKPNFMAEFCTYDQALNFGEEKNVQYRGVRTNSLIP